MPIVRTRDPTPITGDKDTTTTTADKKYYGKYRGTVSNNADPDKLGRILAEVPDVSTEALAWAMPCVPVAGNQMCMYAVPPVGASVWIEFEQGNLDYPIWSGCFWGDASQIPPEAKPSPSSILLNTEGGNKLIISDDPGPGGGIILKNSFTGAAITVNNEGITIDNGKGASITMTGPTVNANKGAFTVL
ncbi:MAG: phage baseplate assembly protein V [Methanoregula sp.]|nr:phage baseplate assembly protein V [Methanoregula sp.]